jgi:uncharacterized repeat protein (TIGR01451 family)
VVDANTGTIDLGASTPGTYTVIYTFGSGGCVNTASTTVMVNPLPSASINYLGSPYCAAGAASVTQAGPAGGSYYSTPGLAVDAITGAINLDASIPGTYTVMYVLVSNGCRSIVPANVTINSLPIASILGNQNICAGQSTTLTASGGGTYLWNTGDTNAVITVSPAGTTNYTVTVTSAGGCTNSTNVTVTVNPLPTAIITGDLVICAGQSTVLTASGGAAYLWSTGETNSIITVSPAATTNYTVTVTGVGGCTSSASAIVTVNPPPSAGITGNLAICAGQTTTLTASAGAAYLWSTGETNSTITVSPAATTNFAVTVTGVGGCTNSTNVTVTVNPRPTAGITGNLAICAGRSTTLSASGGGAYLWNTGETNSAITVSPAATTNYTVTVAGAGGCIDAKSVTVTVDPQPTAGITGSLAICVGQNTTLSASGGGAYLWNTGQTNSAIRVSPAATTNYTVTVTSAGGCTDAKSVTVTVNPQPTAVIAGNLAICAGQSTTLSASGGAAYLWNTGQTNSAITVSPAATTNYTVTVTSAGGCTDAKSVTVTVNPQPTAVIAGNLAICAGQSTTLSASGGAAYLWNTGQTNSAITVSPAATTKYTVTVTSAGGCTDSKSVTVTVNPQPIASIAGNLQICGIQSTILTASGGATYLWNTGQTNSTITVNPAATTKYTVTVTSAGGCTDSKSVTVVVDPKPTASITPLGPVTFCQGGSVTLDAGPGFASYFWSNGNTNRTIVVSQNATLTVRVSNASGCMSASSLPITVAVSTSTPVIDQCAEDKSLAAVNCQAAVPDLTQEILAHDACTPTNLLSVTQSPAPGTMIGVGQTVVTLSVANQGGATATCQAKLTVTTATPTLSIDDVEILDVSSGTTNALFAVTLSQPACSAVTVQFATADGTGVHGSTESIAEPNLSISRNQVVISWPTTQQGYSLQSEAQVVGATWVNVLQSPTIQNGNYIVNQPLSSSSQFYRLYRAGIGSSTPAIAPSDYTTTSGLLTFAPGETQKTIAVPVIGTTQFQPDKIFVVNLSGPVNATIIRDQGIGTIRGNNGPNSPPTVNITSPENNATFVAGADIVLTADAADTNGTISQVAFYAGTLLLGTATQPPYAVTWTNVTTVGDYSLTARAIDNQGATAVSAPVVIHLTNEVADVAIIRNFDDPEIAMIESYLFELGLTGAVFDRATVTFQTIQNFQLVIWDDLGKAVDSSVNSLADVLGRAYNAQIPVYLIGERLASSTANLTEPYRSQWTQLTHFQPATTQGGNGTITILTNATQGPINGRFGFVVDFSYPAELDLTSVIAPGPQLLATSGNTEVLVDFEDPSSGERTVSQNFLAADASSNTDSIAERKRLFQNVVWWLLRKPLCNLIDFAIAESASNDPAQTGQPLTYTLTVQRTGECEGTGVVVTDVLPTGVQFVSAETPQGTWTEANGVVTFHLGALQDTLQLTITVTPTQPGPLVNFVRIRGNESEQNLNNNTASLTVQAQGAAVMMNAYTGNRTPQAAFSVLRSGDGLILIQVRSDIGTTWILETSDDLVHWTTRTQFTAGASATEFNYRLEGRATFYRLREPDSAAK